MFDIAQHRPASFFSSWTMQPSNIFLLLCSSTALAHAGRAGSWKTKRAFSYEFPNPLPEHYTGPLPWPDKIITYCFKDTEAQDKLQPLLLRGFALWENAPGGIDGIKLELDSSSICSRTTKALQIELTVNRVESTPAYFKQGRPNRLFFDPNIVPVPGAGTVETFMAHELGHVFGLFHEHQRPDAPNNVKFNCKSLKDYAEFKKAGSNMDVLCTSLVSASRAGFFAADFIPHDTQPITPEDSSGEFDFESIMIYSSYTGSKKPTGMLKKATLVRADNGKPFERIGTPSEGDTTRLRAMYDTENLGATTQMLAAVQSKAQLDTTSLNQTQSDLTFSNSTTNDPVAMIIDDSLGFFGSSNMSVGNLSVPTTSGLMQPAIPSTSSAPTSSASPSGGGASGIVQNTGCDGAHPNVEECDREANNDPNRVTCKDDTDCNDYCRLTIGNTPDVKQRGLGVSCLVMAAPGQNLDDALGSCICYPVPAEVEEFVMAIGEMACVAVDEALNLTTTVLSWVTDVATEDPKAGEQVTEIFKYGETYLAQGSTLGDCANVACPGHEMTVINMTDVESQLGDLSVC